MKKCDQFKDLILTDFVDGELGKDAAGSLENHLLDCHECRAFFKEVKNNSVLPFQQALRHSPPAELWERIKQEIEQESLAESPWESFVGKLKGLMAFPKLVPAFASLVLMFIVGTLSFNTIQVQRAQAQDQGEYLVSLLSPTSATTSSDNDDPGTSIEHYFL